jgi:hypothetical protein
VRRWPEDVGAGDTFTVETDGGSAQSRTRMRAAAPVGGAQGLSGGALRGTPVGEEAVLGG